MDDKRGLSPNMKTWKVSVEKRVEDLNLRQRREQDERENWLKTELLILLYNNSY